MCFGDTVVLYRAPGEGGSVATAAVLRGRDAAQLTETQRRIVIALCRPLHDSAYATPATNKEIADEVHLSVDAVKAHLRVLFGRFGLDGLPQNSKRARLAAIALVEGVVRRQDF
jgi:DNA-binding NarL/FixJ family response regulator